MNGSDRHARSTTSRSKRWLGWVGLVALGLIVAVGTAFVVGAAIDLAAKVL